MSVGSVVCTSHDVTYGNVIVMEVYSRSEL